jgi:protein involved in polysaccharide export with SLBB domain
VQISGAVNRPGEFSLGDGDLTVKGLIEKADGLKPEAFVTRATLYRTSADLTLAAESLDLEGIMEGSVSDMALKNEDLLFIPSRYDIQEAYYVKISGEIASPGTYPFASDMTVGDLILRAGGLLESATNSSIELARRVRVANSGRLAEISTLTINSNLQLSEEEKNQPLKAFDHVFIRRSPGFEREQLITITGEAVYPGDFAMANANERISDVVARAGGLSPFAYPKGASLMRRTVNYEGKSEEELTEEKLRELRYNLDPKVTRNQNQAESILFERLGDRIKTIEEEKVKNNFSDRETSRDSVRINSELYKIRYKGEDMIGIDLEFILQNPGSEADLILFEGDVLQIPKQLQTVRMLGEVLLPTTARYIETKGLRFYISKAGGFTEDSRRSKSYVIYANGDARRTYSFLGLKFYPALEPGAEIVVPMKPQKDRLNAAAWIGIASSLATLGILINTVIN